MDNIEDFKQYMESRPSIFILSKKIKQEIYDCLYKFNVIYNNNHMNRICYTYFILGGELFIIDSSQDMLYKYGLNSGYSYNNTNFPIFILNKIETED